MKESKQNESTGNSVSTLTHTLIINHLHLAINYN
jgi:hypothetical protein